MMGKSERIAKAHFEAQGWTVFKYGLPDFVMLRGRELRMVEVKSEKDGLTPLQRDVVRALEECVRVSVVRVMPDGTVRAVRRRSRRPA